MSQGPYRALQPAPRVGWLHRLRRWMWEMGVSLIRRWRAPGDGAAALAGVVLKALGSPPPKGPSGT